MTFLASAAGAASAVSAAGSATSPPASNDIQAGVLGFLVVASIGVVLVFLLRSMNKQFRKLGPKPEPEDVLAEPKEGAAENAAPEGPQAETATPTRSGERSELSGGPGGRPPGAAPAG